VNRKLLLTVLVIVISGSVSCILLGILFFGFEVFNSKSPFFQFVAYGIIGSVSFILFNLKRYRDATFVLVLLYLFNILLFSTKYLLTGLLYFLAVIAGSYIYSAYFFNQVKNIKTSRPLILAGIYAILFLIVTLLLVFIYEPTAGKLFAIKNMPIGFLIGLGLGLGIELSDYIISQIRNDKKKVLDKGVD
jgi:hypothetical protein